MDENEVEKVCQMALDKFGEDKQFDMAIEEMSELIKCLVKYRRYNKNSVWRLKTVEEMMDVTIMIMQLSMLLSTEEEMERVMENKVNNLKAIIENDDPERGLKKKNEPSWYDK